MKKITCLTISIFLLIFADGPGNAKDQTNSLGMKMIAIEPGTFTMGSLNPTPFEKLKPNAYNDGGPTYLPNGDYDEHPAHQVTISKGFLISETEVTAEQFQKFRRDYEPPEKSGPYASNISYNDAVAFCQWLSEKEKKPYRLPTEAEWEYVCRAGTKTLFWSGDTPPELSTPNPWGVRNMHIFPAEWCLDWHGLYPDTAQTDPVGPGTGITRVIRGGGLDRPNELFARRSANRAAYAPDFPYPKPKYKSLSFRGKLPVGFRVVQAPMPKTEPLKIQTPFTHQCISQDTIIAKKAPDPAKPYFKKRPLHPVPPENLPKKNRRSANVIAGLHPGFLDHQHSPGMTVCSNGDVLAVYYTSDHENEQGAEVALMISRLRFGADQWDMPDMFIDLLDTNDHAPLLWNDNGTIYVFWGGGSLGVPFKWVTSTDNGQTFSAVKFPIFEGQVKGYEPQPVNSAFRDTRDIMYFASDAGGTMLWASRDNGLTWFDTGGRTRAKHTTFAILSDDVIIGIGGKDGGSEYFNPKSISTDKGKTYKITGSGFPRLSSNQRPSLIRLNSGRLLYATDFQDKKSSSKQVDATQRGAWLAYSDDDGITWKLKRLPGGQPHEQAHVAARSKADTIGYSVLRQGPNGLIHLITSVTHPDLHFAFNEAWLEQTDDGSRELPTEPPAKSISDVTQSLIRYPSGKMKAVRRAGIGDNGRYLLHGSQIWFYEDNSVQYEVTCDKGIKIGTETYYLPGKKIMAWQRIHNPDGTSTWTHYWPNGNKKTESKWKNFVCEGLAKQWNRDGKLIDELKFQQGMPEQSPPTWKATGVTYPE